ncbi:DNA mismatch repair protein mutS [Nosema bombycis CQ1]|uniref:DNA mismatch repair protein mutS n=1 Tax=Nosema bombycis (strain CQ1 / CVCC 102059) TaxID=578461 RepID=R0KMQ1_NOSB1|nr:DNA mismatch repair protein mutS [Nosema bombycis CQ1]|eukprot:EOB11921.1 DNA mismatch repair protein mutS [Nosema bombycis CQ1]
MGFYDQIIELEGEIALNLLKNVMKDLPTLIPICENIAEIDVCLSGYHFSQNYDCYIPKIDDFICISRSFYPPLKSSINNDYYVDKENLLNIITGPNMSGKSTYLKQFAYLTILTQIGYPVTAKSAITKIFTGLYVSFNSIRIDLECMRELLKYHTSSSLIIIDEPGKGYDVDILTAFYSVFFDKLMITKPIIFFITHHYGIFKLNKCKKLNYLQVEQFKVKFGISKSRTGFKICEENIPKIYLDWL